MCFITGDRGEVCVWKGKKRVCVCVLVRPCDAHACLPISTSALVRFSAPLQLEGFV